MYCFLMQLLLDVHQKLYGLHPVEGGYLKISSKTFDPEQAEVAMKLGTDACESAAWGPANDQDPQWIEHQKQFVKVSNFYHFYLFTFKSQTGTRDRIFYVLGILQNEQSNQHCKFIK